MDKNNNQEMEARECPKCGAIGTSKRNIVGEATNLGYNNVEKHAFREPNTPAEGIVCSVCGHCEYV